MHLAQRTGLRAPKTRLTEIGTHAALLVRRFNTFIASGPHGLILFGRKLKVMVFWSLSEKGKRKGRRRAPPFVHSF